jgi:hypothetical protein
MLWMGLAVLNELIHRRLYALMYQMLPYQRRDLFMLPVLDLARLVLIVTLQWLVLRRFIPGVRLWAGLHGGVLAIQSLLFKPVLRSITSLITLVQPLAQVSIREDLIFITNEMFWALVFASAGWIIFRAVVPRAQLWLWAVLLGTAVQSGIYVLLPPLAISDNLIGMIYEFSYYGSVLLAAAQAAVLVMFLRERERPAAPALV